MNASVFLAGQVSYSLAQGYQQAYPIL